MNKNNYCVIMAGGVGARFWPMSKTTRPKQFIDILGVGKTLIQLTFDRFTSICPPENILVVTNTIYKDLVLEQLPELDEKQVLCEPSRRNTAPCVAYANYKINEENPNAIVIVAPSDHIILKEDEFVKNIKTAMQAAKENNWLLTLGIKPSRPDTGYGYIQFIEENAYSEDVPLYKVKTFTEKPSLDIAKSFLASGDFLWNSGIFIWSLKSIMVAFTELLDEVDSLFEKGIGKYNTKEEESFISNTYAVCKNISVDYGIMEKAKNVYTLAVDFGWSDLGTWGSLYTIRKKDANKNAVVGKNLMLYNTHNCIVNVPNNKLVVLQGLDDYIIVEDDNTLLVCRKQDEQQIRQFVADVKSEKGDRFV
ncbi:MAG: mannose-1-phosphate guanylyltransferase [Bacteroidetes bacterium]|nr:mannose-1-phosphate guanylyltransferase [Bacteroidota bacterium]MBL6942736.1 mannose-1-phosphate guanylyltransferase [Bacteroidales bacterium]